MSRWVVDRDDEQIGFYLYEDEEYSDWKDATIDDLKPIAKDLDSIIIPRELLNKLCDRLEDTAEEAMYYNWGEYDEPGCAADRQHKEDKALVLKGRELLK